MNGLWGPYLLNLVLQNLLGNAWKLPVKRLKPRIEMGTIEHNGKQTYFVSDNGLGFDMAYANKLFQPFQRCIRHQNLQERNRVGYSATDHPPPWWRKFWAEGKVGQAQLLF